MPNYIYIDPLGNMLTDNHQDTPQAAITYARMLAAEHQVSRVCVALVIEYKVKANQCHLCHKYFSQDVYDELWPTCPACDDIPSFWARQLGQEPTCPHCGSEEILNHLPEYICSNCGKDYSQCLTKTK